MSLEVLEGLPALLPLEFFTLEGEVHYTKTAPSPTQMRRHFLLPETSSWLAEEGFADLALAWNETGLFVSVFVRKPFEEAVYPRFSEGDAIELFFDTRDLKTASFATRFCHQFVFLPQPVQGISAQEISHFRTEDTHPLCDPSDLQVKGEMGEKSYALHLFIPAQCLHGFDPASFDRIGFNYRIHRYKGQPQHFGLSGRHFSLAQNPRLMPSFKFLK